MHSNTSHSSNRTSRESRHEYDSVRHAVTAANASTGGAVATGRLTPEAVWRHWVSEVLTDPDRVGEFSAVFGIPVTNGPPTHLHFHVARIPQGTVGIPETGGMYRVAINDVRAWTVGDFSYSDH
ncbi:hypothetical protein [Streptomyces sp. Ac-502]|uniref:hypothetical protein n=1 Tax=Streptomyces sp. Ac-502 TaxID=3342801 RepID=UPI003862BD3B